MGSTANTGTASRETATTTTATTSATCSHASAETGYSAKTGISLGMGSSD
jgi:hypothetical protein